MVDGCIFLSHGNLDGLFGRLRGGACNILRLGYRRPKSIKIALATRLSATTGTKKAPNGNRRRPFSRLKNGDIIVGGILPDVMNPTNGMTTSLLFDAAKMITEMDNVTSSVLHELNELEEKAAWLIEESLIYIPHCSTSTHLAFIHCRRAIQNGHIVRPDPAGQGELALRLTCHTSGPLSELLERAGD